MIDLQIRPYLPSDYDAICEVHDASRKVELALASLEAAFLPFAIAAEREDFFAYPHIDVALCGGAVAAFSAYTDEELAWLYVAPKAMGQGIGKKLVAQALATAPGIQSIEVLRGNEPARKLYEAFGFYLEKTEKGVMPGNEAFEVEVYCMRRG